MEAITSFTSEKEIELLAEGFNNRTLPKPAWTHDAHLTMAIWHLKKYDFYEAVCKIKSAIIIYNQSVGGVNDSMNGYHETLTVFWMKVVYFYTTNHKNKSLMDTCNGFLSSPLASRDLPFYFYEKEKLMSTKFRLLYMEPNKNEFDYGTLGKILRKEIILRQG